ncbi:hypothetical protein COCNU_scaffold004857G000020 [Cocos nucifera]|nr:hypothetical protein [Cocos nucifera]
MGNAASMVNRISCNSYMGNSEMQQLTTDTAIEVTIQIPFAFQVIPVEVIESTGTQVLEQLLIIVLPRFLKQLVKDHQAWASGDTSRQPLGTAFKCWCQAAWQYIGDFPSDSLLDSDVMSFMNSVFELLLRVWASSRDLKVRLSSVEALGQMVGLVTRSQLKVALPRLIPTILDLYKKDYEIAFLASCSLHNLLTACLLSESGPPLLDFEMMEEIFLHLSGTNSALPAMVQILADYASAEGYAYLCLLYVYLMVPEAAWQYIGDFPSDSLLDSDVMSFMNSVFELLLRVWASSRDLKVRLSSVEALGQMVGLVTRSQLKVALPRLIPTILDLYKKDYEIAFLASCSLHNLLTACLLSESGPPLLDFEMKLVQIDVQVEYGFQLC